MKRMHRPATASWPKRSWFIEHHNSKAPPVVEDKPLLRMLAVDVFEDAGFIAIEAGDADEAVVLLESRKDITLLYTDINSPGSMDG
jgi:two-component system, response regulator PdtaR